MSGHMSTVLSPCYAEGVKASLQYIWLGMIWLPAGTFGTDGSGWKGSYFYYYNLLIHGDGALLFKLVLDAWTDQALDACQDRLLTQLP